MIESAVLNLPIAASHRISPHYFFADSSMNSMSASSAPQ
jgi:hypothetical protein